MAKWICEDCGKEEESYGKVTYRRCPSCDLENLFLIVKQIGSSSPCSDRVRRPCCADCKKFKYQAPCSDQPYPEYWCSEGEWDGIASTSELEAETDCEFFERAD